MRNSKHFFHICFSLSLTEFYRSLFSSLHSLLFKVKTCWSNLSWQKLDTFTWRVCWPYMIFAVCLKNSREHPLVLCLFYGLVHFAFPSCLSHPFFIYTYIYFWNWEESKKSDFDSWISAVACNASERLFFSRDLADAVAKGNRQTAHKTVMFLFNVLYW